MKNCLKITFTAILIFTISACTSKAPTFISLTSPQIKNNNGKRIYVEIESRNAPQENSKRCATESLFVFTYKTNAKEAEIENYKNFKIKKSDLYLLINDKKIYPYKIFTTNAEFNSINSSIITQKSAQNQNAIQYITFRTPCQNLTNKDSRLIISKIYKDVEIIKQDAEFGFALKNSNKAYQLWLE